MKLSDIEHKSGIYFIYLCEENQYKIGKGNDVFHRLKTGYKQSFDVICVLYIDHYCLYELEAKILREIRKIEGVIQVKGRREYFNFKSPLVFIAVLITIYYNYLQYYKKYGENYNPYEDYTSGSEFD